jgi:hypothetical protein
MATVAVVSNTATATLNLSLSAREGETLYVSERSAIDALVSAQLELKKAEDAVHENALAIAAAESALSQARSMRGMMEFNAARKRKAVKEANDYVCDSLKSARQTAFKAGARGAGLYADMTVVRAMVSRFSADRDDADAEDEKKVELGYAPCSPSFTPPDSPILYVRTLPSQVPEWGLKMKKGSGCDSSSSSEEEEDN